MINEVYKKSGLGRWFHGESATKEPGWDRYNSEGKRVGKCGDAKTGSPYSACLSKQKARKLGKSKIASFVKRKRRKQKMLGRGRKGVGGKGMSPIFVKTGINEAVDKSSMKCNKPRPSTRPGKKMMVKACEGGREKIVHFGAKGYGHNYSSAARKSFRARHKCGEKKSKLSAQYWACRKLWAGPKGSTAPCPENRQCKENTHLNFIGKLLLEAKKKKKKSKNVPTDSELWSRAIQAAKSKFDVYPSAYANAWASKWYKEHGGDWKASK
jgi:hypothetical protein